MVVALFKIQQIILFEDGEEKALERVLLILANEIQFKPM